jgi:hypothetical protein
LLFPPFLYAFLAFKDPTAMIVLGVLCALIATCYDMANNYLKDVSKDPVAVAEANVGAFIGLAFSFVYLKNAAFYVGS